MTWAKYFYDELVCQSLGSTLLVFVSNFPSFMSIGRKQHNGYQLLTFLLLTVPPPLHPPPAGRDQDVNLSPLAWPSLGWWGRSSEGAEISQHWDLLLGGFLPHSEMLVLLRSSSQQLLSLHRVTYCQDKIAKLKDVVMIPNDFYHQDPRSTKIPAISSSDLHTVI